MKKKKEGEIEGEGEEGKRTFKRERNKKKI